MKVRQIVTTLALTVAALVAATPSALAWGSCARGPWVQMPPIDTSRPEQAGPESSCDCRQMPSPFSQGGARVSTHKKATVINYDPVQWEKDTGHWVAIEFEARNSRDERLFIPGATYSNGEYRPISNHQSANSTAGTKKTEYLYDWPWQKQFSLTGRYRSVCLNVWRNFTFPQDRPWEY